MRLRKYIKIVISLVLLFGVAGCKNEKGYVPDNAEYRKNFTAMDTYMSFTAYGKNAEEGLERTAGRIAEIEKLFSVTDEDSEVYAVNHRTEDTVRVSQEVWHVLDEALETGQRSGGAFDISVYPVLQAWGFTTGSYHVPSDQEIQELLKNVGYDKIKIDGSGDMVTLEPGMEIDFGGIVKGYSGDEAVKVLKDSGVNSAILSLGGNIQALGTKPDGSDWTVAVKDPEDTENYMGLLKISDKAVVTSGGYERFFEGDDGEIYWHILDPATGRPAKSGLISVTVVGDCGMDCDALSTALFVKGLEGASEYWKKYGGFDAIFITEDREVYITEGIRDTFTLSGKYENETVKVIAAK